MKQINIAMFGFGGIARSHYAAYTALMEKGVPIRIVAVCDANAAQFQTQIAINNAAFEVALGDDVHLYTQADDLIANEAFDAADICLPTHLHKEITLKLLRAGKHVLCEKPMALCSADCEEMAKTAKQVGKQLLIGHCLRFSPAYRYLKELIDRQTYGKLLDLHLHRASMSPSWSAGNWLQDRQKSGGCILDTHIHDIDIANYFFGMPQAVSSLECDAPPYWQTVSTRLFYPHLTVTADGSWHDMPNTKFTAGCKARVERANVIMELYDLTVSPDGGTPFTPSISTASPIDEEVACFVERLLSGQYHNEHTPNDFCNSVKIIERMRESARSNGEKLLIL